VIFGLINSVLDLVGLGEKKKRKRRRRRGPAQSMPYPYGSRRERVYRRYLRTRFRVGVGMRRARGAGRTVYRAARRTWRRPMRYWR
jgi:hypothetical protein